MTQVHCECGKFKAELENFPKNSAGRLVCYCDDCQCFLHFIGRPDLLDSHGGTEIIPIYPKDFMILQGKEFLKCMRLSPKGLFRWYTSCCNTPIGNNIPKFPWLGTSSRIYTITEKSFLEKSLGAVKSRVLGSFAKGTPPEGTSARMAFRDIKVVFPFILKGLFLGKNRNSPLYEKENQSLPIVEPYVLSLEERNQIRMQAGFPKLN